MVGLGRYYEMDFVCRGEPDAASGYLINIKDVDRVAREAVVPRIEKACDSTPGMDAAELMAELFELARSRLPVPLAAVRWRLTPTYSVEMIAGEHEFVVLRQRFDFAAAHRLHVPGLTDEENRRLFGRCNNPSGHGHNYMIEPAVRVRVTTGGGNTDGLYSLAAIERSTQRSIIDRFDHTHLNKDTEAFAELGGENPSVENIAKVFFELLSAAVREDSRGSAELKSVTVWETDRTSSTFPG